MIYDLPMRIVTWNVNGLRAAIRKGFAGYLHEMAPDVLLLQEVRCFPGQLPQQWATPAGWHVLWHPAKKPGYAGTAVWSRAPIELIGTGHGPRDADEEGRVLLARTAGVTVASIYLPKGEAQTPKQTRKETWMGCMHAWAEALLKIDGPVVLGGDLNIAHSALDLHYAKSNENASGFLAVERAWLSALLESGWCDVVRRDAGEVQGPYSWWSNRGNARALDRGWRIDYLLANASAAAVSSGSRVYREAGLACSDHAPVALDLQASAPPVQSSKVSRRRS